MTLLDVGNFLGRQFDQLDVSPHCILRSARRAFVVIKEIAIDVSVMSAFAVQIHTDICALPLNPSVRPILRVVAGVNLLMNVRLLVEIELYVLHASNCIACSLCHRDASGMNSLAEIAARHSAEGADPGHGDKATVHSYIPHYERLLAPYRDNCRLLEVGIACGNSLRMWAEYFGAKAEIVGVDIHVDCSPPPRTTLIQADATKPEVLEMLGNATFDVIIDDGSHMQADQEATFRLLSPRVRAGGLYIIEDILSPDAIPALAGLYSNCEVIDLRHVKGRFDDMLLVYKF